MDSADQTQAAAVSRPSSQLSVADDVSNTAVSTESGDTTFSSPDTVDDMNDTDNSDSRDSNGSEVNQEGRDSTMVETPKLAHDSMVTVRLSEPPTLTLNTSLVDVDNIAHVAETRHSGPDVAEDQSDTTSHRHSTIRDSTIRDSIASATTVSQERSLHDELDQDCSSDDAMGQNDKDSVNWERLEKTEDEQPKDEDTDNSTALLLARLEQENAKLATNPKSVKVRAAEEAEAKRPRPPSMAQLQEMVNGPTPSALRYSMLPPPPMTDLEFYAALVKDYQQTAARLPTLLSNKIRKGIPPPLRGVVWQSMSGARDAALEEQYERFCGESSPYELIIGKDLGRSFPGVDMFRDPEGDGQRMLGRVLKSFSLYDTKIGYCQGLAFLVGPLLMHMPEKQAFCVLIRLMDHYDLRTCFLPDLSGLHVRIYQFRELLRHNLPALSAHLEELQVDPAYVSQWFLSFFAVTCPLPMLFRIYDVIFAEGASETLMRVALSLMRKNEQRLLSCTELEDVMQLLLSRGLWDCYHYDADEFVQDFVSLTSEVSREKLGQLEKGYRDSLVATANATRSSAITNAATRFLGRIWASSAITSPKIATLSPGLSAPARPLSMLRRSTSKQSLASTLNSMEASSSSVTSSNSTDASSVSRDSARSEEESSSRESTPVGPKSTANPKTVEDNYLHSQIEDLLTALSELQRNHAVLSDQLQQEREERQEDHEMVQTLLTGLRAKGTSEPGHIPEGSLQAPDERNSTPTPADNVYEGEKRTDDNEVDVEVKAAPSTEDLSELLERVEARFASDKSRRLSSMAKSKSQLQDDLALAKDQLACAMSQSQDYSRQINDLSQEVASVRDQLRESHAHVRSLHQDKQRLEKQVHGMRSRSSAMSASEVPSRDQEADWPGKNKKGGLREFKLARSKSSPSQGGFTSRLSSLSTNQEPSTAGSNGLAAPAITTTESSSTEQDLLHELVQAKTAEAVAKQEAEEAKQKLEALRKAYGLSPADTPPAAAPGGPGAVSVFGRLTGQGAVPVTESSHKPAASTSSVSAGGGGFWGWRR